MPYEIGTDPACPASKPHAVLKSGTGERMGCHATVEDARKQMAALYAQEVPPMTERRSAMPMDGPSMCAHLMAPTPDGHAMSDDMDEMSMPDMTSLHDAAHGTVGVGHDHPIPMSPATPPMRSSRTEGYEIRTAEMWPDADYELRATKDDRTLEGYAAVFGIPSLPMSFASVEGGKRFREVINAGAFTRTLNTSPDVSLLWNHDLASMPLARTKSGTMTLTEDERGLRVRASLPSWADNFAESIARGDISGMSFRFASVVAPFTKTPDGYLRTLREVKLGPEVSITNFPAYPDTSVSVRMLAEEVDVDPDDLALAFRVLRDGEARLTAEQRDLLIHTINERTDTPILDSKLVQMRERLAAIA